MTDNRTNEPSEQQVEWAARAFFRECHGEDIWPELRDDGELDTRSRALAATRAALVAAQGAASQEVIDDAADEQDDLRMHMLAPQEPCPQPCEHLSAEDAREGLDCREHPCICPTASSSDREKLIEEARAVVPQAETSQCGPCRRGQHGCCDENEYLRCECSHGAAPQPACLNCDEPVAESMDDVGLRAERDAALAAIGRVRAVHRRLNVVDEISDERVGEQCEVCGEIEWGELEWPCSTIQALDGVPEPEVKP